MKFLGVILVVLAFAPLAFAGDATCKECGVRFERSAAVRFGMMSFCSEACKEQFKEQDRHLGTCTGCGVEVKGDHREFVSGNTRYIKIGSRPKWDGYCNACRGDVKMGQEVGTNRRKLEAAAEDAEWEAEYGSDEPAPEAKAKKQRETPAEAESGFGAMTWVLVIAGAMFAVIKFFLK